MKTTRTRILSGILLLAMLVGLLQVSAFAADTLTYTAFTDDFSDQATSNTKWSANPAISGGAATLNLGAMLSINRTFTDAEYDFSMAVTSDANWTGFLFNRTNIGDTWDNSGYMIYMRSGHEAGTTAGQVDVLKASGLASVPSTSGQVPNYQAGELVPFRVRFESGHITVYAKNTLIIDMTDSQPFASGYAGFFCSGTAGSGSVDSVSVKTVPPTPDTDDEIAAEFAKIKTALAAGKIYIDDTGISNLPWTLPDGYSYTMTATSDDSAVKVGNAKTQLGQSGSSQSKMCRINNIVTPSSTAAKTAAVTWELKYSLGTIKTATDTCDVTYTVPKATTAADTESFLDAKYGIFVHYVWAGKAAANGTDGGGAVVSARYPDGTTAKTIDEMIDNFDAAQFAADCKAWGVQYVMFTAWHYQMHPLYPSAVYNQYRGANNDAADAPSAGHDLIEKVYEALHAQGIDLYLYTHPYDLHNFTAADKAAFSYKSQGDLTFDYDKWNEYLNAQYKEMFERYKGKVKGMFIDEGLANPANNLSVDYPRLRDTIKAIDPSLVMIQNEYNGKYSCDTSMMEMTTEWKGGTFGQPTTWHAFTRSIGTAVGSLSRFSWWAQTTRSTTGNDAYLETPENMFSYTVLEAGTNTEGGGAAWAAGPFCGLSATTGGNIWENGIPERFAGLYKYLKPIETSVKNTRPSKSYVTPDSATLGTISWGTATESKDGLKTYIHVLKPTSTAINGKTLTLAAPADGKIFTSAKLLVGGAAVTLTQTSTAVTLTLPASASWDTLDTVIVLDADRTSALQAAIADAKASQTAQPVWIYPEDQNTALTAAIAAAQTVLDNQNATAAELAAAVTALNQAVAARQAAMIDSVPGTNLALGKSVTASTSLEGSGWAKTNLTDGNVKNGIGWTSNPHSTSSTPNNGTEWAQVDLGSVQRVGRIDLQPRDSSDGYGFPKDFKVEISEDGQTYKTVYQAADYNCDGSTLTIHFAAQNARYVRVTATKLNTDQAGASYRMQLSEIQVYDMSTEEAAYRATQPVNPARGAAKITYPTVPDGFTVSAVASASPAGVIAADGTITVPAASTDVSTRFAVKRTSDGTTVNTRKMTLTVLPAAVAVTEVSLNKTTAALTVGGTETLTAAVQPENATNQNVTWASSDENIATVANGVVTAKAPGTAAITVTTADGGKTAVCTVTVKAAPVTPVNPVTPGTSRKTNYKIESKQITGGKISTDTASVAAGASKTYTFTPDAGYKIKDVIVDGKSVGAVPSYTFQDVSASHTITVEYAKITPSAFIDVKDADWFAPAVQWASDNNIMNGVGGNRFAPNDNTTRAMIVAMLYRQAGSPDATGKGVWYDDARAWAMKTGVSDGTNMLQNITREQLAAMLWRKAGKPAADTSKLNAFTDGSRTSAYAKQAVAWAIETGILTGKSNRMLDPTGFATRAETALMFMRFASL
jgi:alpha-L-fucosidase